MRFLLAASGAIDKMTALVGRGVKWLILAAILISAGNAVIRKAFDTSSNAWLELQWYLYGIAFMLAAAHTLRTNDHIRIDILSSRLSRRTRIWLDLAGHFLMLLPFVAMMIWLGGPFFVDSFVSGEVSANAGGLTLWPVKAAMLFGFILLLVQAISEIIKCISFLVGISGGPDTKSALSATLEREIKSAGEHRND